MINIFCIRLYTFGTRQDTRKFMLVYEYRNSVKNIIYRLDSFIEHYFCGVFLAGRNSLRLKIKMNLFHGHISCVHYSSQMCYVMK